MAVLGSAMAGLGDGARAEETRVFVLTDGNTAVKGVVQAIEGELRRAGIGDDGIQVSSVQGVGGAGTDAQVIVALGPRAMQAAMARPAGKSIIVAWVARSALEAGLAGSPLRNAPDFQAISLDQPLTRWLSLVESVLPHRRELGILLGPSTAFLQRPLERLAAERNFTVQLEIVRQETELMPALERVLGRSNLFIAFADPLVHNRSTVQPLLLSTYRAGVPVIGFSETYTSSGAIMSIHSGAEQIGRQVGEAVVAALRGRMASGVQYPRYFRVSTNPTVARSLGLNLPSAQEIEDRLLSARDSSGP